MLVEREAARVLGCSTSLLRAWRRRGEGPPYLKIGRLVRYASADLDAFLRGRRVEPTGGDR